MDKRLSLSALALLAAGQVFAGGYQVALQGQKQIGMGHTGTALAWDASSIFFNPGSLGFLKKSSIVAGASFISSTVRYIGPDGQSYQTETKNPVSTPFAAYGAFFLDKDKKFIVGLGINTPFGSTVKWDDHWKGADQLRSLNLTAITTYATVGYRINDIISVGAGFNYAFGSVDLKRQASSINTADGYGDIQLKGNAYGMGYNVGIHVQPTKALSIGLAYRSKIDMEVEKGDATANVSSIVKNGSTFPTTGKTKFDATLPLPGSINFGLGYKVNDDLTLAADVNYVMWSAYKELKFDFEDNFGPTGKTSASPRNYKDVLIYRVGLDYAVTKMLNVRGGAYLDNTPVKDGYMTAETPDANRTGLSLGLGVKPIENLSIDASVLFILGAKRTQTAADMASAGTGPSATSSGATQPGTYQQRAFIPGIQIGYQF